MNRDKREDDSDERPDQLEPEAGADTGTDGPQRKSRSQKKREAHALHDVGEALVGLSDKALSALPLDEALRQEILTCRPLKKNARSRQLRLIAKLLRHTDTNEIEARLSEASAQHGRSVAREQGNEAWRTRLLDEGDAALAQFVEEYPQADVTALRQLIRAARHTPETARTVRARRELLRAVRALRG